MRTKWVVYFERKHNERSIVVLTVNDTGKNRHLHKRVHTKTTSTRNIQYYPFAQLKPKTSFHSELYNVVTMILCTRGYVIIVVSKNKKGAEKLRVLNNINHTGR